MSVYGQFRGDLHLMDMCDELGNYNEKICYTVQFFREYTVIYFKHHKQFELVKSLNVCWSLCGITVVPFVMKL